MAGERLFASLLGLPLGLSLTPEPRIRARCGEGFLDALIEMASPRDLQRLNEIGLEWDISPLIPANTGLVEIDGQTVMLDARTPEERRRDEAEERRRDEAEERRRDEARASWPNFATAEGGEGGRAWHDC